MTSPTRPTEQLNGTVKWYNRAKGYGFIAGENKKDYFLHFSAVVSGDPDTFTEGTPLRFLPLTTPKGFAAESVEKIC